MITALLAFAVLTAGASAVLFLINQETGTGPRVSPRAWLVVEVLRDHGRVHREAMSGVGDAEVMYPGRVKPLKLVRGGHLYVAQGWTFEMGAGTATLRNDKGTEVRLQWSDERPEDLVPKAV